MPTKIIETKTQTFTRRQYNATKQTYHGGDFDGAVSSAIKSALKHQRPTYLYGVYYKGWVVTYKKPTLPYSQFMYEFIPTGELTVEGRKVQFI
jgi:hypothetical protein